MLQDQCRAYQLILYSLSELIESEEESQKSQLHDKHVNWLALTVILQSIVETKNLNFIANRSLFPE